MAGYYCKPFSINSATSDPGILLKTTSDVNVPVKRISVMETYDQILNDLTTALPLLPDTGLVKTRPSKAAVQGLLAKVYLSMQDYKNALTAASTALTIRSGVMDYNNASFVNPTATLPFAIFQQNPEIIFFAQAGGFSALRPTGISVPDSILYNSYQNNDLRKTTIYRINNGLPQFRGSYAGAVIFCGIATNELLLIQAECQARAGNIAGCLQSLDQLLQKRFKSGTYVNQTAVTADDALKLVLNERRKELAFTSFMRWEDLRRLNSDSRFQTTLQRVVNGVIYTLSPGDNKYVYPIPDIEIQLNPSIVQNPR
jgi:hypothetical protein